MPDNTPDQRGRSHRYDRVMRSLAQAAPVQLSTLIGVKAIEEVHALSESFPSGTRVPDQLLRIGATRLLHLEFTRRAERSLTPRMLVYRGLIMERFPDDRLEQGVVVLGEGRLKGYDDLAEHGFALDLNVLYLREQQPELFLSDPELAPLAVLTRGTETERATSLSQALVLISNDAGARTAELLEAAGVMATIHLSRPTIDQAVRETGMTMDSIARFYEGTELGQALIHQGRQEGRQEGRDEARLELLSDLLQERFGDQPEIELIARRLAQRYDAQTLQRVRSATALSDLTSYAE